MSWNRAEVQRIIADTPFLSIEDLDRRFSSWDKPMELPHAGYEKKFQPIYSLDQEPVGKGGKARFRARELAQAGSAGTPSGATASTAAVGATDDRGRET
jgi:hypothetical protein